MAKESIKIFVEGDAIALAFDPAATKRHSADLQEIGQRLGFVSIRELHDSGKENALRDRIAGYLADIRLEPLKIQAVLDTGISVGNFAIQKAGDTEVEIASLQKLLSEKTANKEQSAIREILAGNIEQLCISTDPASFRGSLAKYAADQHIGISEAIDRIIRPTAAKLFIEQGLSGFSEGYKAIQREFDRVLPATEQQAVAQQRQKQEFDRIFDFVPASERDAAWAKYNNAHDKEKSKALVEIANPHLPVSDNHKMLALYDKLAGAVKEYGAPIIITFKEHIDFKMVERLKEMQASPHQHADRLLADMRGMMDADYKLLPATEAKTGDQVRQAFLASLLQAPELIRDTANATGLEVVIAKPGNRVGNIVPRGNLFDGRSLLEGVLFKYAGAKASAIR